MLQGPHMHKKKPLLTFSLSHMSPEILDYDSRGEDAAAGLMLVGGSCYYLESKTKESSKFQIT